MGLLLNGLNDKDAIVQYGNSQDVCIHCLKRETQTKPFGQAERDLAGKLESKKILRLRWRGTEYVLCKECAKAAVEQLEAGGE